jgi:hypothetical protein
LTRFAIPMRFLPALLILLALPVAAVSSELLPSARLLQMASGQLAPGRCVLYGESGASLTVPEYFVRGRVVAARVEERRLVVCPEVAGKGVEQYSREEFNRRVLAQPCVSSDKYARDVQLGIVRLRVDRWETPHARRAANAGRLYRGMFIDRALKEGMEIELEADLLGTCDE